MDIDRGENAADADATLLPCVASTVAVFGSCCSGGGESAAGGVSSSFVEAWIVDFCLVKIYCHMNDRMQITAVITSITYTRASMLYWEMSL